ncbi:MAG TPA: 23S rRNA (guanosine(2251)-2'-O)-methyltransferase RlmB [Ilumatobacteraceae bacterium]|nr:23S rRNA (guanosine(2251)-2'-O)-methyltransferase RlmB [Ilumatobacteraceae bacterium]
MSPSGRGKPRAPRPGSSTPSSRGSPKRGSPKPRSPRSAPAQPTSSKPRSSKGAGRSGPRSYQSRGAGRTGPIRTPDGRAESKPVKILGGEQIEGRQAVRELLIAQRRKVHEIWVAGDLEGDDSMEGIVALAAANRVPLSYVGRTKLEATARSEAPQGVLARASALPEAELATLIQRRPGRAPFLVALDSVTDPGNLGAIIRSCDGAGVDGVILPRHRAVHVTPTVAKAAAGGIEHVPIAVVAGLPAALARVREAGIWVVGLDDDAERTLFDLGDLAVEGVCLVLGAEGTGLSRLVRERCDVVLRIPMKGRLGSLNVSAAAALAVYEVLRHRTTKA